jgi:carbamoyltransferase
LKILGISAFYHDSAACLVEDGRVIAAAQEERFTRVKHDHRFPLHAAAWCLSRAGIGAGDLDLVAFHEKPFAKFERLLDTYMACAPDGFASFLRAMPLWLKTKLRADRALDRGLDRLYRGSYLYSDHHLSHAASAFFPSPFERAACLTMDGVGEWSTTTWGVGDGARLELREEIRFPHSLGLLYSAFTYHLGFKVNSGEYKAMGLAPYGEPRYADLLRERLVDLRDDGSFALDMDYFTYAQGLRMTGRRFDRLIGWKPRDPEAPLEQRHMDLARSVQEVTEEAMLRMARHVHARTGERNLCLAGGVALNCVGNGRILREGPFERVFVQPAAGDAGGALGAALYAWHGPLGRPRVPVEPDALSGSLLGPEFDDDEIAAAIAASGLRAERLPRPDLLRRTAALLDEGKAVGWFQGRMEFGPRALGARSILGDPRKRDMQRKLNLKIKFRESFRPFAPAVLAEEAGEWFDLRHESPYMLLVAPVAAGRRVPVPAGHGRSGLALLEVPLSEIPAVTHVDGSARVQTVDAARNPGFHALLREWRARTGCPVLVNTSFNVRGEPIVGSPGDALRCFRNTHMDALALGSFLLEKDGATLDEAAMEAHRRRFSPD